MSRAGDLLYRLDRIGHPVVNEQTPYEQNSDDDSNMTGQDQSQDPMTMMNDPRNPNAAEPDSPFNKDTHNPDGSMKVAPDEEPIDDRGRFVVKRRR